jgi:putative radical SAM enzyme (TIGR03279 family)
MALFQEVDLSTFAGGQIVGIEPGSLAEALELRPGDELLAINDETVEDIIDVQYYAADEELELLIRRDGELLLFEAERDYDQTLGLQFAHPTFDTDIRRCNNLCEFCFVLQMAPKFRRTLYIKDDDYRYSFLFGHFVTLTNLSDHDWWRVETMRLSPLYVSVHVTDTELRRRFLRNATAPDIIEQLRWLAARHIDAHTQLVIVPGFNDGEWLARSVRELAALRPSAEGEGGVLSISVVPVGLTSHHKYSMRPHTREEAAETLDYIEALQAQYRAEMGIAFVYPTDEWYLVTGREVPELGAYDGQQLHENGLGMVRAFLDDWQALIEEIGATETLPPPKSITLATATLFADVLREKAAEFADLTGCSVTVQPILNRRLGESITVAGLLMGGDVIDQLAGQPLGDLVVLPRVTFDHPDLVALDDLSPQDVANRLGRTVVLADSLADVWDVLLDQGALVFEPGQTAEGSLALRVIGDDEAAADTHFS